MNETDRTIRMRCSGATLIALGRELRNDPSDPAEMISTSVALLEDEVARLRDLADPEPSFSHPIRPDHTPNALPF
jgi:hypothetical protein